MISRRSVLAATAALPLAAPSLAAPESDRVMRFIPQSELNSIDPAWIPAANVRTHGYLVFDTLYGIDGHYKPQPQMVEGASVENDDRLWQLRLRPGLAFHDGTPVLARDCVASINRFCARDSMGQALMAAIDELSAPTIALSGSVSSAGSRCCRTRWRAPRPSCARSCRNAWRRPTRSSRSPR